MTQQPDDPAFLAALAPERRYEAITLGEPRNGYPGDRALFFTSTNNNGTNIVNLRPADLPPLRAALIPEDPDLKAITAAATAALGPGARKYVQQAHSKGYGLGVRDMESIHETMTEAERVSDWLAGFYEAGADADLTGEDKAAIGLVRVLIERRMKDQAVPRG